VTAAAEEGKEVEFENFVLLRLRSGNRVRAESGVELAYPTDFDPPQIATKVDHATVALAAKRIAEKGFLDSPATSPLWPSTPITPTSFEYRSVGSMIEVEPALSADKRSIDTNLALKSTKFTGWEPMFEGSALLQPKFDSESVTSANILRMGQPSFIGTLNPAPTTESALPKDARVRLVFITPSLR
jgi:hypothetical protein